MPLFRILQNPFGDFLYAIGFLVEYTLVRLVRGLRILGRWLRRVLGNLLLLALRPPIRALLDLRDALHAPGRFFLSYLMPVAAAAGLADRADSPEAGAGKMIRAIRELRQRLDIPEIIPEIRRADIPQLARYADKEANPLYPVPRLMDAGELERFYTMVMEEQESYETGRDPEPAGRAEVLVFQR